MKDVQNAIKHLREDQKYPATKKDLVSACYELSDFSEDDKKWFTENLPEKTYNSADEVISALGIAAPHQAM